jgi:hypothetical protein
MHFLSVSNKKNVMIQCQTLRELSVPKIWKMKTVRNFWELSIKITTEGLVST